MVLEFSIIITCISRSAILLRAQRLLLHLIPISNAEFKKKKKKYKLYRQNDSFSWEALVLFINLIRRS